MPEEKPVDERFTEVKAKLVKEPEKKGQKYHYEMMIGYASLGKMYLPYDLVQKNKDSDSDEVISEFNFEIPFEE